MSGEITAMKVGELIRELQDVAAGIDALNARLDECNPAIQWAQHQLDDEQERIEKIKGAKAYLLQRALLILFTPVTVAAVGGLGILTHHLSIHL